MNCLFCTYCLRSSGGDTVCLVLVLVRVRILILILVSNFNGLLCLFRRTDQTLRFQTNIPLNRFDLFFILTMDLNTTTTITAAVLGSIRSYHTPGP